MSLPERMPKPARREARQVPTAIEPVGFPVPTPGTSESPSPERFSLVSLVAELCRKLFQLVFRMVPYPTRPRLIRIGHPDRSSPVLVTGNYDLTVRRVCRALRGADCYLLVAPSAGIDVWCAAVGGRFNVDSILSILKTSGVDALVDHRRLLLPQLAAGAIDLLELYRRTGWMGVFGPLWAEDIPEYLRTRRKSQERLRVTFTLTERLEMATALWGSLSLRYTWIFWLILGWSIAPWRFMLTVALFSLGISLGCTVLPGKTMIQKAGVLGILATAGLIAWTIATGSGTVFALQWTAIFGFCSFLVGASFPSYSPYWTCNYSNFFYGICHEKPAVIEEDCIGCGICNWICPVACFSAQGEKMALTAPESCIECGACTLQCPTDAIVEAAACS